MIHRKTEGHPLFATGAIQLLAERGDILRRDGVWTLAQPLSETTLDVPESVRSMIEQKVGVLTEDQARVLRYASIEGAEFFSTVLAALLEADELELEEQLDQIGRTHGWIRRQGEEELPDGSLATRYRFTHVLYQNFLYGELLPKRRVLLHRRGGEALEQAFGGSTAQIATILAMHFERGRDFARAVTYYAQAGDTARARYANREAVAHYSQGLDLTEKLASKSRSERQRALLLQRALARLALGSLKEAGDDYAAILELCEAAGDGEGECRACLGLATVAMMGRDVPGLEKYGQQAHQLAEAIGNQALVAEATNQGALYLQVNGNVTEALREFDKSIPLARRLDHRPALVNGLTFRGVAHFFRSEYKEAEAAELEASRLAAEARDGMHLPLSLYYLGLSQANQGRLSEALANMQEGLELATRNHNAVAMSRIPNGIGWVWRELGDLRKAIEYNEGCVEVARRTGVVEAESNSLINLIYDYNLAGDPGAAEKAIEQVNPLYDGREPWNRWRFYEVRHQAAAAEFWLSRLKLDLAEEHARTLLKNAERYRVPKYVAVARRLLGEIAMLLGDANTAEEELNRSLEPFVTHPVPLTEWKNRAALARLLAQKDRPAAARQAFSEALLVINTIASGVTDQAGRQRFLSVDDVREVVAGSTG